MISPRFVNQWLPQSLGTCRSLFPLWRVQITTRLAWLALVIGIGPTVDGLAASGERRWTIPANDCQLQTLLHRRLDGSSRARACDHFRILCGHGTYAYAAVPIPPTTIIDELVIRQAIKSARPGHQLLVRVVLPRTTSKETGQPLTLMLAGTSYRLPGGWQTLEVPNISDQLAEKSRVLRASEEGVDSREAFVDLVIVNVYGGTGTSDIYLRDPEVEGSAVIGIEGGGPALPPLRDGLPVRSASLAMLPDKKLARHVDLRADVLQAGGRPLVVRAIDDRGEDWEFLRDMGFNTIWLSTAATAEQVVQADRLGLWLVSPTPRQWPGGDLPSLYRRVLSWNGGAGLAAAELPETTQWARDVRAQDHLARRPLVLSPDVHVAAFSRHADIVEHCREPLGSELRLCDYPVWLAARSHLTRPGQMQWASIQTEPLMEVEQQARAFGYDPARHPLVVDPQQTESMVMLAAAAGMRGFHFISRRRLDSGRPADRQRIANLRWLNNQLTLIEPWIAAGEVVECPHMIDKGRYLSILRTDRAWLLLAVATTSPIDGMRTERIVIPAVPASSEAFEIRPEGLLRLGTDRVPGGVALHLNTGENRLVVISREPIVIDRLESQIAEQAAESTELRRQLAEAQLRRVADICQGVAAYRVVQAAQGELRQALDQGRPLLRMAEEGKFADVHAAVARMEQHVDRALRDLRDIDAPTVSSRWQTDAKSPTEISFGEGPFDAFSRLRSPLEAYADGLPWKFDFLSNNITAPGLFNQLATGEFEDESLTLEAGWTLLTTRGGTSARIEPVAAYRGRRGLRMVSRPPLDGVASRANTRSAAEMLPVTETPAIWMQSPEMAIQAGDVVRIDGWLRIEQPLCGSCEGLMIFDSLAGPRLALRASETKGWQSFSFLRAATADQSWRLTFALNGYGMVDIDEVQVTRLDIERHLVADQLPPP